MVFSVCISNFKSGHPGMFASTLYCNTWGVIWNILTRISIFLIGLLSVCRAISMVYPLPKFRRRYVVTSISLYLTILFIQSTIPFWYGMQYSYSSYLTSCTWYIDDIFEYNSIQYKLLAFILIVLEFILPTVPIIGSCIVSVYTLIRSKDAVGQHELGKNKRDATITIILLTIVYIVFNIPMCIVHGLESVALFTSYSVNWSSAGPAFKHIYIFLNTHSVALNSLVNTLLYFCRIRTLREHSLNIIRKILRHQILRRKILRHQRA